MAISKIIGMGTQNTPLKGKALAKYVKQTFEPTTDTVHFISKKGKNAAQIFIPEQNNPIKLALTRSESRNIPFITKDLDGFVPVKIG